MRKSIPIFLIALCAIAAGLVLRHRSAGPSEDELRELAIATLKTIPRSFLVMQTEEQLALPSVDEGGWLLGPRRGQASVGVRCHWGCDLQTVSPADVEVAGSTVRIRLPSPAIFDTAADLASWRFFGKRSGLQFLGDLATGRSLESELLKLVPRAVPLPSPADVELRRAIFVERLNRATAGLFKVKGLTVEFL